MSITLPHILYGIDIQCTPLHSKSTSRGSKGSVNFINKLTSVQHAGVLAVTGGFRMSPNDSLDAHTALLSIDLGITKACHNMITRMATLLHEHLLHALIKKSAKGCIKRHHSLLHILASIFGINPSNIKKIPPVHIHPRKRGL